MGRGNPRRTLKSHKFRRLQKHRGSPYRPNILRSYPKYIQDNGNVILNHRFWIWKIVNVRIVTLSGTHARTDTEADHTQAILKPIIRYTIDIFYSPSSVLIPLKGGYIIDMNRINFILALTPMGVPKLHFNIKPGMGRNNAEHQHEE